MHRPLPYLAALRTTLRKTAAAYGYALTIGPSAVVLTNLHGRPSTGQLFLFVGGALTAFALLDAGLEAALRARGGPVEEPRAAFPGAGALNYLSVMAGLGGATALASAIDGGIAWLVVPLVATALYLLVVALQVAGVDAVRRGGRRP